MHAANHYSQCSRPGEPPGGFCGLTTDRPSTRVAGQMVWHRVWAALGPWAPGPRNPRTPPKPPASMRRAPVSGTGQCVRLVDGGFAASGGRGTSWEGH